MASVNRVILVGHIGQDPEIRYTNSGEAAVNISLATSEQWKDKASGEQKNKPNGIGYLFLASQQKLSRNICGRVRRYMSRKNSQQEIHRQIWQ